MGLVINPRGTSGAGKTWLVREVMAAYRRGGATAVPLHRAGRSRPMGWRLTHPRGGRPLAVIGHYEATRGGTDTIPETDGGLDEAFRLADALAAGGDDVVLEGYRLSGEVDRMVALARAQRARGGGLHVLCLDAPIERSVHNVMTRRRAGASALPGIERTARAGQAATAAACAALRRRGVRVEGLDSAAALRRTLALLGLDPARHDGPGGNRPDAIPPGDASPLRERPTPDPVAVVPVAVVPVADAGTGGHRRDRAAFGRPLAGVIEANPEATGEGALHEAA